MSLTAGGVKLVFVNLDPDDPNRIFFAILDVVDDKIWNSKYMAYKHWQSLYNQTHIYYLKILLYVVPIYVT